VIISSEYTVRFEHGVSNGTGRDWREAVDVCTDHLKRVLGDRFAELGEVVEVTHPIGTNYVVCYRREHQCITLPS
jgi:hypothetical protein